MTSFIDRPIIYKASTTNICFRYTPACGVSFTKYKITGAETAIRIVIITPHTTDSFKSRMPYVFPRLRFPAPSSFPTIIPAALDIPALRQHIMSRTTAATEFAAAASVPRCPINDEYDVNPIPHTRLAPRIGPEHFIKSFDNCLFLTKSSCTFNLINPGLYENITASSNSTMRAISVASAAPRTFILLIPNAP